MSKGVLASFAALAASAGVAFGQGPPSAAPQSIPGLGAAAPISAPSTTAPLPGAGGFLPQATEMPHTGVVGGSPMAYPGFPTTFGEAPTGGASYDGPMSGSQQVHKAAGGPDRCWIDVEYLTWRVRSLPIPFPLAVASPPASQGILGQEGTRVLFGNDNLDYGNYFNVLRLTGGVWGQDRIWGLGLSGFIQEARSDIGEFVAPINGRQVLARPLIDALTGQASAVLVGFPGQFSGDMFINARMKLGGAEANILRSCVYCDRFKLNFLAGVRYIDHDETLYLTSRSTFPNALVPEDPTFVDIYDEFACRNQFFGGQVGFDMEFRHRRFFIDLTGKIAIGNQHEELLVRGFTNTQIGGVTTIVPYGMLALAGNSGVFNDNEFAYVPEGTVKFGYQWTQRFSTFVGYNILYISRVLRPGDQIDPYINPVFLPVSQLYGGDFGPVRPINSFNKSDIWVQGVTFGLSLRF